MIDAARIDIVEIKDKEIEEKLVHLHLHLLLLVILVQIVHQMIKVQEVEYDHFKNLFVF
jgi:hypothetical protein